MSGNSARRLTDPRAITYFMTNHEHALFDDILQDFMWFDRECNSCIMARIIDKIIFMLMNYNIQRREFWHKRKYLTVSFLPSTLWPTSPKEIIDGFSNELVEALQIWYYCILVLCRLSQLSKTCHYRRKSATVDWNFSLSIVRMLFWTEKCFPENQFGRSQSRMRILHVFCILISEINLPKTVERTYRNGFLSKDAAIVLTDSVRFSARCCCKFVSENLFLGTRLPL